MGVPKNFNQLEKRVESLNELSYYTIEYDYTFTKKYREELDKFTENEWGDDVDKEMVLAQSGINGVKEFTALDDDIADKKVNEWLGSLVEQDILKEFNITNVHKQTFYEKIKDKKLDTILDMNKQ